MELAKSDRAKYKKLYLQTAQGYYVKLILKVSFFLSGRIDEEKLYSALLAAHSLKSQSFVMGYNNVAKLSEAIEGIFRAAQENKEILQEDLLLKIQDDLRKLHLCLEEITDNDEELDLSLEIAELKKVVG